MPPGFVSTSKVRLDCGFEQVEQQQPMQIVPTLAELAFDNRCLSDLGHDYLSTYLYDDDGFFNQENTSKIDSTQLDLRQLLEVEDPASPKMDGAPNPLSQDNDPFLPALVSAMLNPGENEAYRDLSCYLPSLTSNAQYPTTSITRTFSTSTPQANTTVSQSFPPSNIPSSTVSNQSSIDGSSSVISTQCSTTSVPTTLSSITSSAAMDYFPSLIESEDFLSSPSTSSISFETSTPPPCKVPRVDSPASTSSGGSTEKYVSMRKKNNMASRQSRLTKKQKEKQMEDQANQLEAENERLRRHVAQLDAITQRLKNRLLSSVKKQ